MVGGVALRVSVNSSEFTPRKRAAGTRRIDRTRILIERFRGTFYNSQTGKSIWCIIFKIVYHG